MESGKRKLTVGDNTRKEEIFPVYLTNGMTYDKLHDLAREYSLSVELLVELAVKRFIGDVEFVRSLRAGSVEGV